MSERERERKREILERVRWWPIWRWDLKLTSKITTSTTTTNFNHFPIHFFFQVHPSLSFFNSPPLDWILSKPHLNFSAYLCRSFTFPSFLVKMVIWVCLVSLIWAVKICSFLNYNVDYVHGLFFSFPFLYYVLVTEENLSFGFWSLFNSHFSSLSDPKEAVVHNLSLSLSQIFFTIQSFCQNDISGMLCLFIVCLVDWGLKVFCLDISKYRRYFVFYIFFEVWVIFFLIVS